LKETENEVAKLRARAEEAEARKAALQLELDRAEKARDTSRALEKEIIEEALHMDEERTVGVLLTRADRGGGDAMLQAILYKAGVESGRAVGNPAGCRAFGGYCDATHRGQCPRRRPPRSGGSTFHPKTAFRLIFRAQDHFHT